MKIDLSTLLLVVIAVIPGLFAQRSRDMLVPRSFTAKGASEELAELVAFGLATHILFIFLFAGVLVALGVLHGQGAAHLFRVLDGWDVVGWCRGHGTETAICVALYVLASYFVSHLVGIGYGIFSMSGRLTAEVLRNVPMLSRFGVRGVLGERPIIYELLDAQLDEMGVEKTVFIEAEMKDGLGFYSGQLSQFAIVRDEEPHRPVYLVEPWFKGGRDEPYVQLEADGILLDLADVACLLIKQTNVSNLSMEA